MARSSPAGHTHADVVALQLAIQGGTANAKHASSEGFITIHLLKDTLDRSTLNIFEVRRRQWRARSIRRRQHLREIWIQYDLFWRCISGRHRGACPPSDRRR